MSKYRFLFLLVVIATVSAGLPPPIDSGDPAARALQTVTAEELRSTVRFLASDAMLGRRTSSQTNQITARYLAHQFELLDLEPVGDEGTFFQHFTLLQADLDSANILELEREGFPMTQVATVRNDFYPSPLGANGRVSAPLAPAGYGISLPESGYNDLEGTSLRDRIALLIAGDPPKESLRLTLRNSERMRELARLETVQNAGALGVIIVHPKGKQSLERWARGRWPKNPNRARFLLKSWTERIHIPVLHVSAEFLKAVLPLGKAAAAKEPTSDPVKFLNEFDGLRATLQCQVTYRETVVENVLGALPGADSSLSKETVIVSAHLDHVGERNGAIFNGADDDASGTAAVIEIAEAFMEEQLRPRRSILFAFWNAEEMGLLGSRFYTNAPVFPLERTVAVLQMDMVGRNQEVPETEDPRFAGLPAQKSSENENTLHLVGYSQSLDLAELIQKANSNTDLRLLLDLDSHPLNLIRRSDHWPFLIRNIPSLLFTTGLHPQYHTPEDTSEKLNYAKMAKIAQLVLLSALECANADHPPKLNSEEGGL